MELRIDPYLTFAWRTPDEIQIGAPLARAKVHVIDDLELRAIDVLRIGTTKREWERWVSQQVHPQAAGRLEQLLTSLQPALLPQKRPIPLERVTLGVQGDPELVAQSQRVLPQLGYPVVRDSVRPDVTLVLAHHVLVPEQYRTLLQNDWPHLPLVATDAGIEIGPLVNPGVTSCAYCLDQSRIEDDPSWPAVAMQLRRRREHGDTPLLWHAALVYTGFLMERLRQREVVTDRLFTVLRDGGVTERAVATHPNCRCRTLEQSETELARATHDHLHARPPARAELG